MSKQSKNIFKKIKQPIFVSILLMILCGLFFPLVLTGLSNLIFPRQSKGNLLEVGEKVLGSETVGQEFLQDYYLWSRPSSYHYNVYVENEDGTKTYQDGSSFNGIGSGSTNYGPSNEALIERVEKDIELFLSKNPTVKREDIPADLVTASGSGLDPHISRASAEIQIPRIVKASGLSKEKIEEIIENNTHGKVLGIFGEETVNVVKVNLEIGIAMGLIQP